MTVNLFLYLPISVGVGLITWQVPVFKETNFSTNLKSQLPTMKKSRQNLYGICKKVHWVCKVIMANFMLELLY